MPEGSSTTMMLVIVVGVFLLVETPLAVFLVVMIAENTFGASILTTESRDTASLYLNLFTSTSISSRSSPIRSTSSSTAR